MNYFAEQEARQKQAQAIFEEQGLWALLRYRVMQSIIHADVVDMIVGVFLGLITLMVVGGLVALALWVCIALVKSAL